jgi:hypothetical protein
MHKVRQRVLPEVLKFSKLKEGEMVLMGVKQSINNQPTSAHVLFTAGNALLYPPHSYAALNVLLNTHDVAFDSCTRLLHGITPAGTLDCNRADQIRINEQQQRC